MHQSFNSNFITAQNQSYVTPNLLSWKQEFYLSFRYNAQPTPACSFDPADEVEDIEFPLSSFAYLLLTDHLKAGDSEC
jgi:hypothetical protein